MILHTVTFRLKRPVGTDARAAFEAALRVFGASPPHAVGPAELRFDLGLRPEGASVSESAMSVRFVDEAAFAAYLADPAHVALVTDVLEPACERWLSIQSADTEHPTR